MDDAVNAARQPLNTAAVAHAVHETDEVDARRRVFVVDDDEPARRTLGDLVVALGYDVALFASGAAALAASASAPPAAILLDLAMPGMDGHETLQRLRQRPETSDVPVVVVSGAHEAETAARCLEQGAADVLPKPVDPRLLEARLRSCLELRRRLSAAHGLRRDHAHALEQERLLRAALERRAAPRRAPEPRRGAGTPPGSLVGTSAALQAVLARIRCAAESSANVLLTGESGTGKELAARAIHALGPRAAEPFFAINCSALPDTLLESELFGHARGAFTGAVGDRDGAFASVGRGTLFLDEIGDVSAAVQVKLLRALESRTYRRLGEDRERPLEARIVSATNRDLAALRDEGRLREDFYYRVRVFEIHMPPLRERREDVPALVDSFVGALARSTGRDVRAVAPDALRLLCAHAWPGNVRQLRNALEHAFVTVRGPRIEIADLPEELRAGGDAAARPADADGERARIVAALRRTRGRRAAAAELLGCSRVTLWKRMRAFAVTPGEYA